MIARRRWTKSVLWMVVGVLLAVTVARFKNGLGTTTSLSDSAPWGLWIAFDVMAGVALAAGGFVLAATVHIFRLEKYERFVRPAILTALLGYAAVTVGLLYDLGLPWRIWHPLVHPQPHSVLFEVAMCVMFYLAVLALEFSPVVLEHPLFDRKLFRTLHKILAKVAIPLVILGVVLSTLHQSSLGSLFLIAPYRLHPLWYSPIIWVLFFVSAVGLGLMTVTLESYFSAWFFGHKLRIDLLAGLGRAGAAVLTLYALLRLGDLAVRGELGAAFDGSAAGNLFLFELALSAVVPAILLWTPRIRKHPRGLGIAALMSLLGLIGYRFDVCLVAFQRPEGMPYFPSWMELSVTLGIIAGAVLIFTFFVEHLRVYPEKSEEGERPADRIARPEFAPQGVSLILPESIAGPRRYSLAALTGAALAVAFLPADALTGARPMETPVSGPRTVEGAYVERAGSFGHDLSIRLAGGTGALPDSRATLLVLDGNRDGRLVLFHHEKHEEVLGGEQSCVLCHHLNLPFQEQSGCSSCHADMYVVTDTFDHSAHIEHLNGNEGCIRCHEDTRGAKTRKSSAACLECHRDMLAGEARVALPDEGMTGLAVGYMKAMHGLCIGCHKEQVMQEPDRFPVPFAECLGCHRDEDGSAFLDLAPYVTRKDPAAGERRSARAGSPTSANESR